MKRVALYIVTLFASIAVSATEQNSLVRWEAGNKAYIEGDYEKAIEEYRAIVEGGEYSGDLYYNMANAYFKSAKYGKAILYYNKALRLDPSSDDIRHNLALAEAQTKDKITAVPEFFLNGWLRTVRSLMSCTAWTVTSFVMLALAVMFALLFLLASGIKVRKSGFFGALCAILLYVITTTFAVSSRNEMLRHDEAIVMGSAIAVKSSPDSSATDLFVLHEGTKVHIVSEMDEWCEIVIADGKKGWTLKKSVENI